MSGKCMKCGKRTKYAIRYDIDSSPIYCHKKCETDVQMALIMLINAKDKESKKMLNSMTKDWYCPIKLK